MPPLIFLIWTFLGQLQGRAHSAVLHACKHVRVRGSNPLIWDNFECLKLSCLLNFDPVGLSLARRQCINRIFFTRTPRQLCDLSLYTTREITILRQNAKIKMENIFKQNYFSIFCIWKYLVKLKYQTQFKYFAVRRDLSKVTMTLSNLKKKEWISQYLTNNSKKYTLKW